MGTQEKTSTKPSLKYSFLKDIYIELYDYEFFHSPSSVDKIDKRFRGRKKIENKLFDILTKSKSKSGAYLITGYRGVGKTSLVNKVLSRLVYNNDSWFNKVLSRLKLRRIQKIKAPQILRINLGHDELKEKDILNLIAKSLLEKYSQWNSRKINVFFRIAWIVLFFVLLVLLKDFLPIWLKGCLNDLLKIDSYFPKVLFKNCLDLLINMGVIILLFIATHKTFKWFFNTWLSDIFPNNQAAMKKLKFLNQRIDAFITNENQINVGKPSLGFRLNNKVAYSIAGSRDIEVALINIFEYIDRISNIIGKPKFIFVFDELDKIRPNQNATLTEKEGALNPESKFSTSAETTRKRQEKTSKILANLKHFFSTARAKFIFIAGREMYDATLADISDRNYFLGSIFHDIIYVNSFLTEDPEALYKATDESTNDVSHTSYYHTMAEEFLCQFLMPKKFEYDKPKGKITKDYVPKYVRLDNPEKEKLGNNEKRMSISLKTYNLYLGEYGELKDYEREKVILILNQFITYLLHRSSGSPKKLTHLLERYICKDTSVLSSKNEEYKRIRFLVAKNKITKEDKLFLHFDYYSQHIFGFINYLTIPYYYNISRHVKRYNDKLMVSTSYLIDHLYKFHDFGFSWRNLEVTPEIIDVNKAPTLRKLIEDIVGFLTTTHLQHVVSGLYDFKFKKKISYEINFLSKISEREAAALNFTLDESHEVKGHFYKKLEKLSKDHESTPNNEYVHSIGFIQQSLGDLYYYDQEYDDASVIYKDAIQYIRSKRESGEISLRIVVVLSRIMLKMGLSFERKKAFTSAYMAYCELSNLVIESLEVELKKINIKKFIEDDDIYIIKEDTQEIDKEANVNFFEEIFKQPLYSESHRMIIKGNITETVRLLYQPFIAKLHVQDKEKIGGVTEKDIELALKEISFLTKITNPIIEKKILSEYHNKIADFLFFSNHKFKTHTAENLYLEAMKLFIQSQDDKIQAERTDIIDLIFEKLIIVKDTRFSFEELKMIASNLSDYGDTLLANIKGESNFKINSIQAVKTILKAPNDIAESKDEFKEIFHLGGLNSVIINYTLSYFFYFKNDDHSKAAFQIIKILHVLEINRKELFTKMEEDKIDVIGFLKEIKEVVNRVLYSIYRSYNSSTRQEIERMKGIFKIVEDEKIGNSSNVLLNNLPSISEVQEVLMGYKLYEIGSKKNLPEKDDYLKIYEYLDRYNPSMYSDFSGMYSRLNSLYVKIRANYQVFFKVQGYNTYFMRPEDFNEKRVNTTLQKFWDESKANGEKTIKKEDHELIRYLIADSIYCLTETIRILKTFGVTYITNNSTFGFAYDRRSTWCNFFQDYDYWERKGGNSAQGSNKLYISIRNLIGSQAMSNLESKFNLEKAISYYVQGIESHQGKFAYNQMAKSMHYLDNDFNDNHLHFFAALERYKIKERNIQGRIEECKKELNRSKLYDIEKYIDNNPIS